MKTLKLIGSERDSDPLTLICVDKDAQTYRLEVNNELRTILGCEIPEESETDKAPHEEAAESQEPEPSVYLSPREIQHRVRTGQSVEELAKISGNSIHKIEKFAHPVLLERSRVAQMALAAHPVRKDGPTASKLSTIVENTLMSRGIALESTHWDAWKAAESSDKQWVICLTWHVGKSENKAHWSYSPGSHGGTVNELDDAARDLADPQSKRSLQSVSGKSQRVVRKSPMQELEEEHFLNKMYEDGEEELELMQPPAQPTPVKNKSSRSRTSIPAWEDVVIGVRSIQQ